TLGHAGRDGSTPAERATRAGYRWRFVGENVAAGQPTPEAVVAEWLGSPRHCANLMDSDYTEMGVAYVTETESEKGIYWVQMFGTPAADP
ncbi:MAG: CAP domain-containing protein, partial [Gemmatimonadetes bacterium]|nr:CAP domain-containing protein [Gemmatimonadota bacterium]